jgi:AraC family transcriptional regulator, transcriptional activator of pobA
MHRMEKYISFDTIQQYHLSNSEYSVIIDCLSNIKSELQRTIDKHTKTLTRTGCA